MKNKILTLCSALCLLVLSSTVSALPIYGSISFNGTSVASTNGTNTLVTAIDFDSMSTTIASGDFSSVPLAAVTSFTDLIPLGPILNLWTAGGFTFELTNIIFNQVVTTGTGGGLLTFANVQGKGIVRHTGYDDTSMVWSYSSQVTGGSIQTFSATVPAPAGIALLGLALVGFGYTRRNKKSA